MFPRRSFVHLSAVIAVAASAGLAGPVLDTGAGGSTITFTRR